MSTLIRELIPRLNSYSLNNDFVEDRSLVDVLTDQIGKPLQPTAIKQLSDSAAGKSPTPFTSKVQLDR
jgi:hypothetical protein